MKIEIIIDNASILELFSHINAKPHPDSTEPVQQEIPVTEPIQQETPVTEQTVTQDAIKNIIQRLCLSPNVGVDATVALLKQFGAQSASSLKQDQYSEFMAEAKKKLGD